MATEKSWQARISEATDAMAQSFVESISYDQRLFRQDIAGSSAHAAMLARVGLITVAERDAIIAGLQGIERDIAAGNFKFDISLEDIHMVIEAELIKRIGEPGKKLHTARSRNDQVALDLLLWISSAQRELIADLKDLCRALHSSAEKHKFVVMPSYTHLQRAQPISAAAELLAWAQAFWIAIDRFDRPIEKIWTSPLGSGAIAGTSLPIDRAAVVQELANHADVHFAGASENSIFSTANRDKACDFVYACAMTSQWLSRWAEQWILYMSTEFSFIKIADRYTTSSSMMPQKKNPDLLELIRGRCGNVYGDLFALMTILKGLPIAYNRDLQEDKRLIFRAFDTVKSCITMAAAIVSTAEFQPKNIEPTLERGFLDATSLAEYLVTRGIPFRTAHHIVGSLVARCEKENKSALAQLTLDDFNAALAAAKFDVKLDVSVYQSLGSAAVVARYRSTGAAGGKPLLEQLSIWKKRLE